MHACYTGIKLTCTEQEQKESILVTHAPAAAAKTFRSKLQTDVDNITVCFNFVAILRYNDSESRIDETTSFYFVGIDSYEDRTKITGMWTSSSRCVVL